MHTSAFEAKAGDAYYYKGSGIWQHHRFLAFCAFHKYCLLYFRRRAYCLVFHYVHRRTCVWTKFVWFNIVYLSFEGGKGQWNDSNGEKPWVFHTYQVEDRLSDKYLLVGVVTTVRHGTTNRRATS